MNWNNFLTQLFLFESYSFLRFFIMAGLFFVVLYKTSNKLITKHKIQDKEPRPGQVGMEIKFALSSVLIYGLVYALIYFFASLGWNQVYFDLNQYSIWYLAFSFVFLFIFHDTWFYWFHRLLHNPKLFNKIHRYHHLSNNPTPWTAFSVHPVEALIEASYLLVASFIFPVHSFIILAESLISMIIDISIHSGFEFYPQTMVKNPILKWLNTSTHHNLHHQRPRNDFGLITNFWDIVCKTTNPDYEKYYGQVQAKIEAPESLKTEASEA